MQPQSFVMSSAAPLDISDSSYFSAVSQAAKMDNFAESIKRSYEEICGVRGDSIFGADQVSVVPTDAGYFVDVSGQVNMTLVGAMLSSNAIMTCVLKDAFSAHIAAVPGDVATAAGSNSQLMLSADLLMLRMEMKGAEFARYKEMAIGRGVTPEVALVEQIVDFINVQRDNAIEVVKALVRGKLRAISNQ